MHRSVVVFALCAAAACGDNHTGGNAAPTVGDLSVTTEEDTPATGTLTVVDADGDNVTIEVTQAQHGAVTKLGTMFTYTPDANFNGTDSFTVTVSDGKTEDTGTVTIEVTPVNDAPMGVADSVATDLDEAHEAALADLLANDTDVDGDTLTVTDVGNPTNGTIAIVGTDAVFTPTANFVGSGSYRYTVSDGELTADVTVTVAIGGNNDAPVAVDDTATTAEDTDLVVTAASLAANDTDANNQTLSVTAVTDGTGGTVALDAGDVTFTPTANFNGTATFTYTVSDGALTDTGTVTVTVTAVNDAPVATDDAATTAEDTAVTITNAMMVANDTDVDTGTTLTVTSVANATNGSVSLDVSGDVTFTPTTNFSGTGSYEYTVSDGDGGTDTGIVTITITAVNDAPVAVDDMRLGDEDVTAIFASSALVTNDVDIDGDALTVTSVSNATNGSVSLDVNGDITFTPSTDFNGNATFDYVVSDGTLTDTGTVTMVIGAINDAPVAVDDAATTPANTALVIPNATLVGNDTDIDAGDTLTVMAVQNATNGSVSATTTDVTFTPTADFTGTASFEYIVRDAGGLTDVGLVTITVTTVNVCGDGVVAGGEACDDDDNDPGDGCNATCQVEVGWSCAGNPSVCTPICGDGMMVGDELCDDNNQSDGDGCDSNCTPTGCGNTIVTTGEDCDDGDLDNTDGCTNDCNAGVVCTTTAFADGDRFAVDPVTGHCYVAFDSTASTFADAQASCAAAGGYLATITSAGEQTIVAGVQTPTQNMWIGGNDVVTEGTFTWVTGEPFTFTDFAPLQPDDDVGLGGDGDCLHLFSATDGELGKWNDTNCALTTFVEGQICELEVEPCGDGVLQVGEQCDDGNTANGDGCSATCETETLFFSEYVEGSSNSKALEIRNPFSTAFDLAANSCVLRTFFNGNTTFTATTLTGTIPGNGVRVICNSASDAAVLAVCNQTVVAGGMAFNGNDAVALICGTTTLDVIGQIGNDPTTEWGTGITSTADNTLRRKCTFRNGDADGTDVFNPATEFDGFPQNTFAGLGVVECP